MRLYGLNYSRTIQPTIARKKIARDKSIPLRLYGLNYSRTIQPTIAGKNRPLRLYGLNYSRTIHRTIAKKKIRAERRREKEREIERCYSFVQICYTKIRTTIIKTTIIKIAQKDSQREKRERRVTYQSL